MKALRHSLLILFAVGLAYLWLQSPLVAYSAQLFAGTILVYLMIKKLRKAKIWHLAPSAASLEMPFITFSLLLIIGATGNLISPLFFLSYIHLFFLALSCEVTTAIWATILVMLFHSLMTPNLVAQHWSVLLSLPLVMIFFLFAKYQYQEGITEKQQLASEKQIELNLVNFLNQFLEPKIIVINQLISEENHDLSIIRNQLDLIMSEIKKILNHVNQSSS